MKSLNDGLYEIFLNIFQKFCFMPELNRLKYGSLLVALRKGGACMCTMNRVAPQLNTSAFTPLYFGKIVS